MTALVKWPAHPDTFTEDEARAWKALGKSVLPMRTCSEGDLLMLQMLAQEMARLEVMRMDPAEKSTAITACAAGVKSLMAQVGIGAQGRDKVQQLPLPESSEVDPLDEFAPPLRAVK